MGTHPIFESDFDCLTDRFKMTKGTTSRGTRNDKTHILCRVTGRRTYHIQKRLKVLLQEVPVMIRPTFCAELLDEELIIFKRNDPPSEDDSTGPPRPRDELPQVLADADT